MKHWAHPAFAMQWPAPQPAPLLPSRHVDVGHGVLGKAGVRHLARLGRRSSPDHFLAGGLSIGTSASLVFVSAGALHGARKVRSKDRRLAKAAPLPSGPEAASIEAKPAEAAR
ncbi:unnamed protein product, partial [Effrenium voratum]